MSRNSYVGVLVLICICCMQPANGQSNSDVDGESNANSAPAHRSLSTDEHRALRLEIWDSLRPVKDRKRDLTEVIAELEQEVVELLRSVDIPEDTDQERKALLLKEKRKVQARARDISSKVKEIQNEVDKLDVQITLLDRKLYQFRSPSMDITAIKGKVTNVSGGQLKLDIGSKSGIRLGTGLNVYRNELFIAHVQVVAAEAEQSDAVVKYVFDESRSVRTDDEAVMLLDPATAKLIGDDLGESIYNDTVKRLKFHWPIDGSAAETGQRFLRRYLGEGRPPVYGAWGDPRTRSLVVIAPAESEHAIRESLAISEGMYRTGFDVKFDDTLEGRLRKLSFEHRSHVSSLAEQRCELLEAEAKGEDQAALAGLHSKIKARTVQVEMVEKKIEIIRDSLRRLQPETDDSKPDAPLAPND